MQVSSFGKNRKQSLYIQLWWVIHGKPSGKKQRTGSVNFHTEYGLPCIVLWLLLDNEQLSGLGCQEGEGQKVWRVRNRREGVQIGLSLNSANRKERQMVHTVISSHELWRSGHGLSPRAFLWLSCDLILGPNFVEVSVILWWKVLFLAPLKYFWDGRRKTWTTFFLLYILVRYLSVV